jgi:serine/threonine-protein kinase RsbW
MADDESISLPLELALTSDAAGIKPVRKAAETACDLAGLDAAAAAEVGLCVNEALANVIRHAYDDEPGKPISLTLSAVTNGGGLCIEIRDWGSGDLPEPDAAHTQNPLMPGGLGLMCLRKLMDDVVFEPADPGMRLIMCRHRSGKTPADAENSPLCIAGEDGIGEDCHTCTTCGRSRPTVPSRS